MTIVRLRLDHEYDLIVSEIFSDQQQPLHRTLIGSRELVQPLHSYFMKACTTIRLFVADLDYIET